MSDDSNTVRPSRSGVKIFLYCISMSFTFRCKVPHLAPDVSLIRVPHDTMRLTHSEAHVPLARYILVEPLLPRCPKHGVMSGNGQYSCEGERCITFVMSVKHPVWGANREVFFSCLRSSESVTD